MPLTMAFAEAELADQKAPGFSWHLRTNHHLNGSQRQEFDALWSSARLF